MSTCYYCTPGGMTNLETDLRLKSMVEIYTDVIEKEKGIPICQAHEGEQQHFFCVTCYTTVCRDCLVIKHPRSEHEVEELKDIVKTWKGEMTKKLDRVNEEVQKNAANEKSLVRYRHRYSRHNSLQRAKSMNAQEKLLLKLRLDVKR